jgi:MFS transporter, SHS family, lactate transporter
MISIVWYSICNLLAGIAPTFALLFLFRALLGIGMGAEWPAGAALAMESWPTRSRGLMSGVLQGSWSIGFLLSSLAYGLLYDTIGWRGLLILGALPALTVVWIRIYVRRCGWRTAASSASSIRNFAPHSSTSSVRGSSATRSWRACGWRAAL